MSVKKQSKKNKPLPKMDQQKKSGTRLVYIAVSIVALLVIVLAVYLLARPAPKVEAPAAASSDTVVTSTVPEREPDAPLSTPEPLITPPAASAVSGSDIILKPVEPATDSNLR